MRLISISECSATHEGLELCALTAVTAVSVVEDDALVSVRDDARVEHAAVQHTVNHLQPDVWLVVLRGLAR